MLLSDYGKHVLLPEENFRNVQRPDPFIPPSPGHFEEWLGACKTGRPTGSNFDYAAALTIANHLGNALSRRTQVGVGSCPTQGHPNPGRRSPHPQDLSHGLDLGVNCDPGKSGSKSDCLLTPEEDMNFRNNRSPKFIMTTDSNLSRRSFLKTSAALSAVAMVTPTGQFFAAGSDTLRIALIGCGERGTGAVNDCFNGTQGVEIVALADLFQDQVDTCLKQIKEHHAGRCKVTPATSFVGFDAYKKVLAMSEVDIVLLATPPAFRPIMVRDALDAGKHIFMEKPGCVDPVGARSLIRSAAVAGQKGLSIVVGTQQRYQPHYQEILKRIHDGELGQIVGGQAYWNWGFTDWHYQKRKPAWSDLEWQIRCWPYFVWLSGDHIVEQHLHNIDILNWAIGSPPESCIGFGGRQARTTPDYGNIYDHFVIEFQYPGDVRVMSMCSQIKGSNIRIGERVVGSKGTTWTTRQGGFIEGAKPFRYEGTPPSGMEAEHAALVDSIRNGKPINECPRLAESTLTLIMGRYAAYTGQKINWNWISSSSELDLMPGEPLQWGSMPVAPVAVPGQVELA